MGSPSTSDWNTALSRMEVGKDESGVDREGALRVTWMSWEELLEGESLDVPYSLTCVD